MGKKKERIAELEAELVRVMELNKGLDVARLERDQLLTDRKTWQRQQAEALQEIKSLKDEVERLEARNGPAARKEINAIQDEYRKRMMEIDEVIAPLRRDGESRTDVIRFMVSELGTRDGKVAELIEQDHSRLKGNNKRLSEENYQLRKKSEEEAGRRIFLEGELVEARAMVEELRNAK